MYIFIALPLVKFNYSLKILYGSLCMLRWSKAWKSLLVLLMDACYEIFMIFYINPLHKKADNEQYILNMFSHGVSLRWETWMCSVQLIFFFLDLQSSACVFCKNISQSLDFVNHLQDSCGKICVCFVSWQNVDVFCRKNLKKPHQDDSRRC